MTKLARIHQRLRKLRRRRRRVRWGTGYSALAVVLLWLLAAAFLVDWSLQMNRPQRLVAMALCAGVLVWAFRRFARPWLWQRETELDMALLVERQQQIDSDLVAAIQFESPEAPQWGSVQLEQKVIDQTARMGRRLDVMQGVPQRPLVRRTTVLAATCVVLALGVWRFPDHARAFFNRFFLLGPRHYPTQTVIESVRINGRRIELTGWRPQVAKCSYGEPVEFQVICSGRLPEAGRAELQTDRGSQTTIPLSREEEYVMVYVGRLERLVDSVQYGLYLGDAWTEPGRLQVVPLPTINVELRVTPPSYAAAQDTSSRTSRGLRQISVLEGSRVDFRVTSDKTLRQATLSIDAEEYPMRREPAEARPSETSADRWTVDVAGTPLARVLEPIRYQVGAVDTDDLEPERPVLGVIRIKADYGPRIVASALTEFVLPTANPGISYEASDDYGLARLSILPQVTHEDGRTEELEEIVIYQLRGGDAVAQEREDRYPLDLGPLHLVKDDQLSITLQATDYRGPDHEGKTALSEPLMFQVTDERGILAAMAEADRESANRLKTMIQRQIEVGEGQ
jgi:hypothetical protein